MPHECVFSHSQNGFLRQLRAFLKDAPRVVRANHVNINNLGVSYTLSGGSPRPAGDLLHIAPETDCPLGDYRVTCVTAGGANGYSPALAAETVTFNVGARTIVSTTGTDFATAGFVVGGLIRVDNAATAGNNGFWRIASITTGSATNDTITLDSADTLAASDVGDTPDLTPCGGGAIFEIEEDPTGTPVHRGWLPAEQESMTKDGDLWLFMRNGGSWAVGDRADFTLELGNFSLQRDRELRATMDIAATPRTITRKDYDGSWIRDGFEAGQIIELVGTASNDGEYEIDSLTDLVITLVVGSSLTDETDIAADAIPRFTVSVDFAAAGRTITRSAGSWLDDGFVDGCRIEIANAVDSGNNGNFLVDTVTATVITLAATETIADETGDTITITPRLGNLSAWSDFRYGWTLTSGGDFPAGNELDSGQLPPVPDADGNYTSEWIATGPGNDPIGNPQQVHVGWRTTFSGTTLHNVEQRTFDILSGVDFVTQTGASRPTWLYLAGATSMQTFMAADGDHVRGFLDVNTSVVSWFYGGYIRVHGPATVYPRPLFNGGMGHLGTFNRSSGDARIRSFWDGNCEGPFDNISDPDGSGGLRWIDGNYLPVWAKSNNASSIRDNDHFGVCLWPNRMDGSFYLTMVTPGNNSGFNRTGTIYEAGNRAHPIIYLEETPTVLTPAPNQRVPMLPIVLYQREGGRNVIGEFKGVYLLPGRGRATLDTIEADGETYLLAQDFNRTGQEHFAALLMD